MKSHSFTDSTISTRYLANDVNLKLNITLCKAAKAHGRTICLRPLFSQKCSRNNPIFLVETTNFLHVLAVNYKVLSLAYQAQNQVIHQVCFAIVLVYSCQVESRATLNLNVSIIHGIFLFRSDSVAIPFQPLVSCIIFPLFVAKSPVCCIHISMHQQFHRNYPNF